PARPRETGGNPGDELGAREAARRVEPKVVDLLLHSFDGFDGGTAVACPRRHEPDERLVDRLPLDVGTLAPEDLVHLMRRGEVRVEGAVDEGAVRTANGRLCERHSRPNATPPRLAGGRDDDAAAAGAAADDQRTAGQIGTPPALHGHEKRVQIDVD